MVRQTISFYSNFRKRLSDARYAKEFQKKIEKMIELHSWNDNNMSKTVCGPEVFIFLSISVNLQHNTCYYSKVIPAMMEIWDLFIGCAESLRETYREGCRCHLDYWICKSCITRILNYCFPFVNFFFTLVI